MSKTASRSRWREYWHGLVQPSANIRDEEERHRAGLLSIMLLSLLLAAIIILPIWVLANPDFKATPYISIGVVTALILTYLVSRTRCYRLAAIILILALMSMVGVIILTAPGPMTERMLALNFLVVDILLASILLGIRATLIVSVLSFAAAALFFFVPGVSFGVTYSYLVFIFVMSGLFIVTTILRDRYARRLQESERRYRSLFDQSTDAVFILDLNSVHVEVNQRAADMLGYRSEEIIGLSFREIVALSEHEDSEGMRERLLAGEHIPPYERIFRKKDGTEIPVELNVELIRDEEGRPLHIQSLARDITARKEAEEALRNSEEYLRAVISNAPFGAHFYSLESDGRLLFEGANPAANRIFGIDHQNLVGKTIEEAFSSLEQTDIPATYKRIAGKGETYYQEGALYSRDGKSGFYEIQAFQTLPGRMAVFFSDVTERKRAHDQAFALAVEKERVHVLTHFVQNTSHELRTPLAVISTNLYLMSRATVPQKQQVYIEDANQQIARLTDLLDMTLVMTKLDSEVPFDYEMTDINDLVRQAIDSVRPASDEKTLGVSFNPDPSLPQRRVDARWLIQALRRILDNAVRFSLPEGAITIGTYSRDGHIVVEISDTGVGISRQALPHIFERFWREDKAHSTPGFGLGLSIAQKIVERQGGTIEVESEAGKGSTFRVVL